MNYINFNSRLSNTIYHCIMSYSFGSLLPFSFPFLLKMPDLEWNNSVKASWVSWSQSDACGSKYFEYRINYDSNETIQNWITMMDLVCASDYQIGLFGSMYFIGFFIGSAWFMRIADIKGRRMITMISIIGTIVWSLLIFAINNIILTYIFLLIFGIFVSVRILVSYLYVLELVPQTHRKQWNLIASAVEAWTILFIAGYFEV